MTGRRSPRFGWPVLYELPLGLCSYGFFLLLRWIMRRAANAHVRRDPQLARRWTIFSDALLARPGALLLLATTAPRWNPHAVIGAAGPVPVAAEIAFDIAAARASAAEWFFVVYTFPERLAIGSVSSSQSGSGDWGRFDVPAPGLYLVGARYYGTREGNGAFPKVRVDGEECIGPSEIPARTNDFYGELRRRSNILYRVLGWHVYPALRWKVLPDAWVRRMFLPVGNPEAEFLYGAIERGQRIRCTFEPAQFENYIVYVTIYSRDSFPVMWYAVDERSMNPGPESPVKGFYLVRVHSKNAAAPLTGDGLADRVAVEPAAHLRE